MNTWWQLGGILCMALAPVAAYGQSCGSCQSYRMVYQTVYDQQQVTSYRLQYETVLQERQVTTQRPVWETEMRERRYRVAKPVMETSTREQRYTVRRPVTETTFEDRSYDRVSYVTETAEREERYLVQRPVTETEMREQQHVVRRPVQETVMQTQQQCVVEPVTTMRTEMVDQGYFVDQQVCQTGPTRNRLQWLSGQYYTDPVTGAVVWQRGGLHWTPTQAPSQLVTQRVYVPNVVARQVPQTQ
ncbi:MAG: hypothetical protein KDA47_24365, partial [Planctomycetales bacterium]|nr:hypothetical protein [Planctomycetales bacterium]